MSFFKRTMETETTRAIQDLLYGEIKNKINGKRILDIGCEEGRLARMLVKHGAEVCGMDINLEHITKAIALTPGVKCQFQTGDIRKVIPFEGEFDIILATGVFEIPIIDDIKEIKKSLANISRKLKRNGEFYTGFSGDSGVVDEDTANEFEMKYDGYIIEKAKRDKVLVERFTKN